MSISGNETTKKLSIPTSEGLFTYQIFNAPNISETSITLSGIKRKEVTISNIDMSGNVIPKIDISIIDSNSSLYFDITSHSIAVYTEKTKDKEPLSSRAFSYENPNIDIDSIFDLRKFTSYEEGLNGIRNYLYLIPNFCSHLLTVSNSFPLLYERNKESNSILPRYVDMTIEALLQNERVSKLFSYACSRIEEELPGSISEIKRNVPFYKQISSTITGNNTNEIKPMVDQLFSSIINGDTDLPNELEKDPILKKGC